MADLRITESTDAGTIVGSELLPLAQLSTTALITATTISASSVGNVFSDSGSGFVAAGFAANQQIKISGFTGGGVANNITSATIVSVSAGLLYVDVTLTSVAAGDTVTITRWVPRKATPAVLQAGSINTATGKTTPVDADALGIIDSAASNVLKKLTWANVKATLKTYTDTLYAAVGAITGSGLTMSTGKLLGRSTASTGAIEEITVGSGLSLSAGTLSATSPTVDASTVTFTPADNTDWSGSTDPGDVDNALDQLAQRVKDVELTPSSDTSGSPITYTIDTGSTADSDPGSGLLKFNNATQSSATMLYIDNATADSVTLTTYFASLGQNGFVSLVQSDDPSVWRVYKITAVTAASGYYKLTVVNQAGAGSFADNALVRLAFDIADNKYNVGFFFTTTPAATEVLLLHTFAQAVVFADEWTGSVGDIGTNPTSSFILDVQKNGSSVGSVTISTGGAFTFATTGAEITFAIGDQLKVVAPGTADATAANVSITFLGAK